MQFLIYPLTLLVFLTIDFIWLGFVAKRFYAEQLGSLMKTDVNWAAALIFYILFAVALVVFVIQPALDKKSLIHAAGMGAFFGLVTYATYDLTNLATLKNWPLQMTLVDLVWGSVLAASVSAIVYVVMQRIGA